MSDVECISNQIILLGGGKLIRKCRIQELTDEIRPYVFEIQTTMQNLQEAEEKYCVSNILSDGHTAKIRVLSQEKPLDDPAQLAMPTLDDVYLYHFQMNGGI